MGAWQACSSGAQERPDVKGALSSMILGEGLTPWGSLGFPYWLEQSKPVEPDSQHSFGSTEHSLGNDFT